MIERNELSVKLSEPFLRASLANLRHIKSPGCSSGLLSQMLNIFLFLPFIGLESEHLPDPVTHCLTDVLETLLM